VCSEITPWIPSYGTLVKLHCGVFDAHGKSHVTFNSQAAARRFASSVESIGNGVSAMITAF
jgi:hypothetical protein